MILVLLGTQDKSFDRLLKQIDTEIENGNIKEKVIVQAGYTKYKSDNMEIFDLVPSDELEELIKKSRLIITHGGVGSILSGLNNNKVVIAAARLAKYKEHTNDHQKQIVKEFADRGYILELRDFASLSKVLAKAESFKPKKFVSNTSNFTKNIEDYIEECNHISWYNKVEEILWYGFFGLLTTVINVVSFQFLTSINVNVYISNLIAWVLSVIFAFITNKLFVFKSKNLKLKVIIKEFLSFVFFRLLSLGIDMAGMFVLLEIVKTEKLVAKIIMNIVVIVANYIFSKLFIFAKKQK